MKLKKWSVFEVLDRLFWSFIMLFPILSYLIGVRSNFAFPEKEIDKTLNVSVFELPAYSNVDFSGGQIEFTALDVLPTVDFYDKQILTSSGGYYLAVGVIPSVFIVTPDSEYIEIYNVQENVLFFPVWKIPDDFGTIKLNIEGDSGMDVDIFQVSKIIRQVSSAPDIISTQTFEYYWENALGFKPITDNVVGNALVELFDKDGGFFGFFDNAQMFVTILLWLIAVEFAHLFVDFVMFLPRFCARLMDKFTER